MELLNEPSTEGPTELFTGEVWVDPIVNRREPFRLSVSAIRFRPGARTAWHSHALGQTLHVTAGEGLVQSRGDAIVSIHSGDVVYAPPDEWHWHGAAPDHSMTHLSIIHGVVDGQQPETEWGAHVSDSEYRGVES